MMVSDGKNTFLGAGLNADIVAAVVRCYENYKDQPRDICRELNGCGVTGSMTVDDKCRSIFAYLVENVTYRLDDPGKQLIKSPARLLADGCGDCKSLTMFVSSCLHCCKIPHIIRFVNFDGGTQYSHVYPVAIDEDGNEIILDACEKDDKGYPIYNYAREYGRKKDFYYEQ